MSVRKFLAKLVTAPLPRPLRRTFRSALQTHSLTHIIKCIYRYYRTAEPQTFPFHLSLLLCVKDEASYLEEWLEYYILQGVDHFYIYNNNGNDNSLEVLKPYIDAGLVTYRDYPGQEKQREIYNDAIKCYRNETRWLGIIDIDEFIVTRSGVSLREWLAGFTGATQILLHWLPFGSSGMRERRPGLVIERFTRCAAGPTATTKAIVNPRAVVAAKVHTHAVLGMTANEHGHDFFASHAATPTVDTIQINHYAIKSYEEFLNKRKRGCVIDAAKYVLDDQYFRNHDVNESENTLILRYVEPVKAAIARRQA